MITISYLLLYHDYYFSKGRLYYTWKPKDVTVVAMEVLIKYCINSFLQVGQFIYNGNCTEWSAIWSEIKRLITKSHDREAGVRFVITSLISDQNCTTRSAISTLLHSFGNLQAATLVCLQKTRPNLPHPVT